MSSNTFSASAPGRLDVMGGIADYSGSMVLQKAIRLKTHVQIKLRTDYICSITSTVPAGETLHFAGDYRNFLENGNVSYLFARNIFSQNPKSQWVAYIIGCILVLQNEKQIDFRGADFSIRSEVPYGKGVASSAALEVAVLKALTKAFGVTCHGTELARYAQMAENHVAGAPCGLMDQLASAFGPTNALLPIVCQPDQLLQPVTIPEWIKFIGIDSGIRHQVAGASYADVRCAAFMGYTILIRSLGCTEKEIHDATATQNFSCLPYQGYLSNISVEDFEKRYASILPESMKGRDFINQFGRSTDTITAVEPDKIYQIKVCTAHPIYENRRVNEFLKLIRSIPDQPDASAQQTASGLGALMLESHSSYSACGLGTIRTDEIVKLAQELPGITGARVTGGGNGGTVCVLAAGDEGARSVARLHQLVCNQYGENLMLFD
ncbi:MAG: hypothetical protein N2044_01855 [Cyclobacteriaceae bacterium]|nr:hypothetical protein [Cyclobacteriaceae bacterium]